MPHKHTRTKEHDKSLYDLPPDVVAKPLPVRNSAKLSETFTKLRKQKKKRQPNIVADYGHDDTPKAFKRLMQYKSGPRRHGLDDGQVSKGQKRKRGEEQAVEETTKTAVPKILPGERMSDYAARVDQALPVSGLVKKGKQPAGVKEFRTKHEKRLLRIQALWRKEEVEILEKEEEAREKAEEEEEELKMVLEQNKIEFPKSKKSKKQKVIGEADDGDEDPWAVLKAKRDKPAGLHDVVQAPPQFTAVPKEKFKIKNGAKIQVQDIPNASGSLRRREELGETRKDIIANYRAMMGNRRKVQ